MWLSACDQLRLVTYCALECAMTGNNPVLTQHQLIVSTHFIKRKSTAFTSAEAAALKPRRHRQQEADTKRLFKEDVCTVCPLSAYCTSTLYHSARAACGFQQNRNSITDDREWTSVGHLHLCLGLWCFCVCVLTKRPWKLHKCRWDVVVWSRLQS